MRKFSFAQESTRYCNYSKNKFGGEITFIKPCWTRELKEGHYDSSDIQEASTPEHDFVRQLLSAETAYIRLLKEGWKAQQARAVLPNALKTELVMTGFNDDWKHFFDLRYRGTTGAPHPDAFKLASIAHEVILKKTGKDL